MRIGVLARSSLEFGHSLGRRLQGALLNEHSLSEDIGRERGGANGVVDEDFGLRVARRGAGRFDALEQIGEHLAFFGGHVALHNRPSRPRRAYGPWSRSIQDGSSAFSAGSVRPRRAAKARLYSGKPIVYAFSATSPGFSLLSLSAGVSHV
jgi:hypothetical protein